MRDEDAHAPYSFDFVAPPPDLSRHVNSLYKLTYHRAVDEVLPAYSAQLMVSAGPGGMADFGEGLVKSYRYASMLGPLTNAHRIVMGEPTTIYGVSISVYGWAAVTGLPALKSSNRHITAHDGLGEAAGEAALALGKLCGQISDAEVFNRLSEIIRMRADTLPDGHGDLIDTTFGWLQSNFNPRLDDLLSALPYSERQVQRLVKQFFGLPPARLKRQYRALRAAVILSDPNVSEGARDKVYAAFYDQAHMIREIKQFTGRTPRLLEPGRVTLASTTLKAEHGNRGPDTQQAAE